MGFIIIIKKLFKLYLNVINKELYPGLLYFTYIINYRVQNKEYITF